MPDLNMLVRIANFFGVSTDALLGLGTEESKSVSEKIKENFEGLDRRQAVLTAFEISKALIPSVFDVVAGCHDDINDVVRTYPENILPAPRCCMSVHEFYNFTVSSDNVNMAVMLLRNKNNFSWMKDSDTQKKISQLFAFLSDTDTLSICYFIHSTACSESFTADYISKNTGVSEEKAKMILDDSIEFGLCTKVTAHLLSGDVDVYESFGEGNILSLITLAYEHRCEGKRYYYNFNGRCKMIGGAGK